MSNGKVYFPKIQESKIIWANDTAIESATVTIIGTITGSPSQLNFFLGTCDTWDGVYDWESVATSEVTDYIHTFATQGKFLKWKLVAFNYTLTGLIVVVTEA